MLFRSLLKDKSKSKNDLALIRFVIKQFGHRPRNVELYRQALTHKSVLDKDSGLESNERMEFLGDAILDSVVAEFLYLKFPDTDEGNLTKLKSKIVSRQALADIGAKVGIIDHLKFKNNRSLKISTLEGNAIEAIIGAIFLDSDYETVRKIVTKHIFRLHLDLTELLENEIDFKSKLFIWAQKNKLALDFKVVKEENKGGSWNYEVNVVVNNQVFGSGKGSSKKQAEQEAAQETLKLMGEV